MFLKRAGWSLWRHKFRNILILLVFAAILAVTLTSFMIYAGTSHQVEVTQKAVANAVTLTGPTINGRLSTLGLGISYDTATRFVKGPHVERYNMVMENIGMETDSLFPAGGEEWEQETLERYKEMLDGYDEEYLEKLEHWARECKETAGTAQGSRMSLLCKNFKK